VRACLCILMKFPLSPLFAAVLGAAGLLSGCMVPGYPYNGVPMPQTTVVPGGYASPYPVATQTMGAVSILPYTYAPAQVIVAPSYYQGYGWGYWYGNRYWGYQPNCGFWGGRYYNGYRWNGYRPGIHGAPYPYRGGYQGGYHGGYQGQGGWYR
jgi:hypothetical protein